MKSNLKFLAVTLFLTLFIISCDDDDNRGDNLTLNLAGLEELGSDFVYEGWMIVNGSPISTGTFTSVDFPQSFYVNQSDLDNATTFVLSIEPAVDSDPAPSDTKILAGDFSGNSATMGYGTIGDFSAISGSYILATPTDGMMNNENSGIWFLNPSGPSAGLTLPTLPAGWKYEGWAVIDGTPVTTGKFTNVAATDEFNDFSGAMALPMPNGADGFFPGEDFLMNAPDGLTFPLDLAGKTAVISVEPHPDNDPAPFSIKPLAKMIPAMATDHTLYDLDTNLASFPSGSVSR